MYSGNIDKAISESIKWGAKWEAKVTYFVNSRQLNFSLGPVHWEQVPNCASDEMHLRHFRSKI